MGLIPTIGTDLFWTVIMRRFSWDVGLQKGSAGIAEALASLGSYDGDGVIDLTGWPL